MDINLRVLRINFTSGKLMEMMTTSSPDAKIAASVATNGGYNPCEGQNIGQTSIKCVDASWTQNPNIPYCYKFELDPDKCEADSLSFYGDTGVSGFISLLEAGSLPIADGMWFRLGADRNDINLWTFEQTIELQSFATIDITYDNPYLKCLKARWTQGQTVLEAQTYDCNGNLTYPEICQEYAKETIECDGIPAGNTRKKRQLQPKDNYDPFDKQPPIELMLSPQLKAKFEREFNLLRDFYLEGFDKVNTHSTVFIFASPFLLNS